MSHVGFTKSAPPIMLHLLQSFIWSPTTAFIIVEAQQSSSSLPPFSNKMNSHYAITIQLYHLAVDSGGKNMFCLWKLNITILISNGQVSQCQCTSTYSTSDIWLICATSVTCHPYCNCYLLQQRMINTKVRNKEGLLFEHAYHYVLILHNLERLI